MKLKCAYIKYEEPFSSTVFAEPDQSFTPRQIIEQFARNELLAKTNIPSDTIDEDHFSEEQLMNDPIHEFEDELDAIQHLRDNQYELFKEDNEANESKPSVDEGSQESSNQITDSK